MRYAISYISTAKADLNEQGVIDIMAKTNEFNSSQGITGILLYNNTSFFQLIEGEKKAIIQLYERISSDSRHHDIIKFLEKPVNRPSFDGYLTDFITDSKRYDESQLKKYLHYIEVLEPKSQKGLERVIELMMA